MEKEFKHLRTELFEQLVVQDRVTSEELESRIWCENAYHAFSVKNAYKLKAEEILCRTAAQGIAMADRQYSYFFPKELLNALETWRKERTQTNGRS